jgi:outer membrane cobalamin receptor
VESRLHGARSSASDSTRSRERARNRRSRGCRAATSQGLVASARAAQAGRAPTLYDLYFTSPQRITIKALRPESITADVRSAITLDGATPLGDSRARLSLVRAHTNDAIVWFPGNFMWSPANVGREELHGAEARLRVTPSWGEWSLWSTVYDPVAQRRLAHSHAVRARVCLVDRSGSSNTIRTSFSLITRSMGRRPYAAARAILSTNCRR